MLCSTKHPNIVEFLGVPAYFPSEADSDQTNSFGFVFEFCSNGSLFSIIHEKRVKFSFQDKIRLMKELAMSLVYLQTQEIIHRDISSRNILLTGDLTLKLADFGCARKISGATYQPTTISGNPPWMSPEQLGGLSLSFSADVWSFGVVVWELVTETLPWNEVASDLWAMRKRVFDEGHHLPIPQINSALPEIKDDARVIAVIIKTCFSRHPFARPSMATILSSLHAIEEQRSREWIEDFVSNRKTDLERRLSFIINTQVKASQLLQSLSSHEEIMLLARLHADDLDDNLINMYLQAKYQSDLSAIPACPALNHVEPAKLQTRTSIPLTCRTCPHIYGEAISGYHEVVLPDESRYVGDVANIPSGLGMVTLDDGAKLQGELPNNKLVRPSPVSNMRVSAPKEADTSESDLPLRRDDAKGPDYTNETDCTNDVGDTPDIKVGSDAETHAEVIRDAVNAGNGSQCTQGEPEMDGKQKRFQYLKSRLALFVRIKNLVGQDSVDTLANTHCMDENDTSINSYLMQTYQMDLKMVQDKSIEIKSNSTAKKPKSQTYTCRSCPHHHGQQLSGHHEVYLQDGSLYVGDLINGLFEGLGILSRGDGFKLQGQFRSNQLILPFSVEDIRSTLPPTGNDRDQLDNENKDHLRQQFMDERKDCHDMIVSEQICAQNSRDRLSDETVERTSVAKKNQFLDENEATFPSATRDVDVQMNLGIVEHPVFELASDDEPAHVARSPFVGNQTMPPKFFQRPLDERGIVNQNLIHGGLPQHLSGYHDGTPVQMRRPYSVTPGPPPSNGSIHLDSTVFSGPTGPQLNATGVNYGVDPPCDGTPVPQHNVPEAPRGSEACRNGLVDSQAIQHGNLMNFVGYGGICSDQICGGTPGPQAPVANLFRVSTPGIKPGTNVSNEQQSNIYQNHMLNRFESPNHIADFWGAQTQEIMMQGMFQPGTHGYHANNYGYVDHNLQAASQGNIFPFPGAQNHLLPQNKHEQAGSGVKRYLDEQSPFQNQGNYLRPPLLESRVESRQNIQHPWSSSVFQNTGSMMTNEKLRITELQNVPLEQGSFARQLLSHVPNSTGMSSCAGMSPYFDHSMGVLPRR
uniref:Protein kinase domain-containing protein n=1 Tax=Cryptomonas curvata TaxID=233186 RepID=A0A7S0MHJ9_9CRYP